MTTTDQRFEAGRTYSMTSACDHECRWTFQVARRTAKSVWLVTESGGTIMRRISVYNGEEQVFPLGSYSMAPILGARKLHESVGDLELVR
jgi:hypothetical protein